MLSGGKDDGDPMPVAARAVAVDAARPKPAVEQTAATVDQHAVARDAAAKTPKVSIQLRIQPPGATVSVDGEVSNDNPLQLESGRRYELRVEAAGYLPLVREITADKDDRLELALTAAKPPPKRSKASRRSSEKNKKKKKKQRQTLHFDKL